MSNYTDLSKEATLHSDNGAIVQVVSALPGGRTLDVTEYTEDAIQAGHVIYKDAQGTHKPLPVQGIQYDRKEATETTEYVGVVMNTTPTADARVSILTAGQVNCGAVPYPITKNIKNGLPRIEFLNGGGQNESTPPVSRGSIDNPDEPSKDTPKGVD